jgi:hypothetical protein
MKVIIRLSLLISFFITYNVFGSLQENKDTVYITGGTLGVAENAGVLENTINGDTTANGTRLNPNRIYALNNGQVYFQNAPIKIINPNGTLTIVGVPSLYGSDKPLILINQNDEVLMKSGGYNQIYNRMNFVNVNYRILQKNGKQSNAFFHCGTFNKISKASLINSKITSIQDAVPASQDTIYIAGGTFYGGENAGQFESTINGDTTSTGARINPNRIYALYEGLIYYQLAPINVYNPTGTLTIAGVRVPGSSFANPKPIIIVQPPNCGDIKINGNGINQVYGSLKFVNIHYQTMEMSGALVNELFYCGTANKLPQSLTIDKCLFEFCNVDLFDCTNEQGAIGGWPYGAKFRITNSYFRNMFHEGQWWGSRIFQCKHPIDTLWVENNTITTAGLTFLQQNELTDFAYFNHNTIVNNKKYWLLSPYYRILIITNNIFMNQNWVGEDTNVISNGQDPDRSFQSTINIRAVNPDKGVIVQQKYYAGDSTHYSNALAPSNLKVYVSNNINYYDTLLINGYYNNPSYQITLPNGKVALPSYLQWIGSTPPFAIENIPCEWMNDSTKAYFTKYSPANGGGFVEENTLNVNPHTITPAIADASVVTAMAGWNQNQWGDPRFSVTPDILDSKYIYGDYSPITLPGLVNGVKSDAITKEGTGIQVGITKFTDLTENFSQSNILSKIDNLPIGSLIWDDAKFAAYNSALDFNMVNAAYVAASGHGCISCSGIKEINSLPVVYSLSQNYPNPFNPATNINFTLQKASNVMLAVYNVLGQKVAVLVNGYMRAGSYSYQFDAGKLASGVYFYRLGAGEFLSVKKMIVLK